MRIITLRTTFVTADVIHPIEAPELLLRTVLPSLQILSTIFLHSAASVLNWSDFLMQNCQVITSSGSSQFSWHSEFFWYTIDLRFQVGILSILFEGTKFKTQHWRICLVNSEECFSGVDVIVKYCGLLLTLEIAINKWTDT